MWPFSSYPEHSPCQVDGKTYDYVILGGGTAGCVVASRLSEDPNVSVLVLEKGHFKDNLVSRMPLLSQNMFMFDALQVQSRRWSEPISGANGRRNRLWAVEGMGGASRMNAMLWTRGFPCDYAGWSEMGLDDWSYEQLEPYFCRIENAIAHPKSSSRGHRGPMELRRFQLPFVWTTFFEKASRKLGLNLEEDCNDPSTPAMGYYNLDTAIDKSGQRISAMSAYLNKNVSLQRRHRLTVCTGAVTSRLELDEKAGVVRGVHFQPSKDPSKQFHVKARREVIVCSGAIGTPQILLMSGIGPRESSERHQIPVKRDLPAVGATLSDHYSCPIMLEVPRRESFHLLESIWGLWHILLWLVFGKGYLSLSSMTSSIYARTGAIDKTTMQVKSRDEDGLDNMDASQSCNVPDIEIMIMANSAVERAVPGRSLISLYPTLLQPRGSGRVELVGRDPLLQPRITYPLLSTGQDVESARLAVRLTLRLAEEFHRSGYPYPAPIVFGPGQDPSSLEEWETGAPVEYQHVPTLSPPIAASSVSSLIEKTRSISGIESDSDIIRTWKSKTWRNVTDDEIDDYMRRVSHTSLHFSCTCPMSNDERSGVVDQKLRVYGYRNLRIADTSIFPKIPSCHTMAPVMVVAERCADFVRATWGA
ncbi:hypothetical protein CP532_1780 [Ophiocordyceps camponoti-leonardi (nom. inval.)]|nr:hypothetical protein CP532_1780 [Ophiocordyceps camponoti-leonardi (nom. inval.)]